MTHFRRAGVCDHQTGLPVEHPERIRYAMTCLRGLAAILVVVGSVGCDDFERPLPHGYRFVCDNSFECIVADSTNDLVTGSSITAIGRTGDVV